MLQSPLFGPYHFRISSGVPVYVCDKTLHNLELQFKDIMIVKTKTDKCSSHYRITFPLSNAFKNRAPVVWVQPFDCAIWHQREVFWTQGRLDAKSIGRETREKSVDIGIIYITTHEIKSNYVPLIWVVSVGVG